MSRSNRLSDAPSAASAFDDHEARFFERLVKPTDLSTVFQPVARLDDGKLFAYEALVRSPTFSPAGLFAQAAALRSAGRLGRMIREVAVSLCHDTPLFLSVHPSELAEEWLLRQDDPLFSHDRDVYLELTESVPATHADLCESVFGRMRGRTGIYLAVDHFGAGSLNLSLIVDFEPKVVKLDRRLSHELHREPRRQKFLAAMVRLCGELGADVVAEGVETSDELNAMRDCGVPYGQGSLFARPSFPAPPIRWPPLRRSSDPPPT